MFPKGANITLIDNQANLGGLTEFHADYVKCGARAKHIIERRLGIDGGRADIEAKSVCCQAKGMFPVK